MGYKKAQGEGGIFCCAVLLGWIRADGGKLSTSDGKLKLRREQEGEFAGCLLRKNVKLEKRGNGVDGDKRLENGTNVWRKRRSCCWGTLGSVAWRHDHGLDMGFLASNCISSGWTRSGGLFRNLEL